MKDNNEYVSGSLAEKKEYIYDTNPHLKKHKRMKRHKKSFKGILMIIGIFSILMSSIVFRAVQMDELNVQKLALNKELKEEMDNQRKLNAERDEKMSDSVIRIKAEKRLNMALPIETQKIHVRTPKKDFMRSGKELANEEVKSDDGVISEFFSKVMAICGL